MFTEPDTWSGLGIEVLMHLGRASEREARNALRAVWEWPNLVGPYASRDVEPDGLAFVEPALEQSRLFGVATLPNSASSAFYSDVVEDDEGYWVYAGCPTGALSRAYHVGDISSEAPLETPWLVEIYAWLFELARHVYQRTRFPFAVVGSLTLVEVDELRHLQVPDRRYHGYAKEIDGRLEYFPPNIEGPLVTWR